MILPNDPLDVEPERWRWGHEVPREESWERYAVQTFLRAFVRWSFVANRYGCCCGYANYLTPTRTKTGSRGCEEVEQ
jgi:hypothetical protein